MRYFFTLCCLLLLCAASVWTQDAALRFHHVHLNSTAPARAIKFYTRTFDVTKPATVAGFTGIQSEAIYLLFNQVKAPLATAPDSAIWHFGWGSTAMETDYQKHLANGVTFATPLTRLNASLQFAYMRAPDGALVEINTAATQAFLHTHLYSAAPLCAAEWYVKHLGAVSRAQRTGDCNVAFAAPSEPLGVIRSPAATVRFGDISLIIYPQQRLATLVSPRGHVIDHIAFSVTDLNGTLERLRNAGVKVLEEPHLFGKNEVGKNSVGQSQQQRAALIEGPDAIAIELVESR